MSLSSFLVQLLLPIFMVNAGRRQLLSSGGLLLFVTDETTSPHSERIPIDICPHATIGDLKQKICERSRSGTPPHLQSLSLGAAIEMTDTMLLADAGVSSETHVVVRYISTELASKALKKYRIFHYVEVEDGTGESFPELESENDPAVYRGESLSTLIENLYRERSTHKYRRSVLWSSFQTQCSALPRWQDNVTVTAHALRCQQIIDYLGLIYILSVDGRRSPFRLLTSVERETDGEEEADEEAHEAAAAAAAAVVPQVIFLGGGGWRVNEDIRYHRAQGRQPKMMPVTPQSLAMLTPGAEAPETLRSVNALLLFAAAKSDSAVVRHLIEYWHLDVHYRNRWTGIGGYHGAFDSTLEQIESPITPLIAAIGYERTGNVRVLREHGADDRQHPLWQDSYRYREKLSHAPRSVTAREFEQIRASSERPRVRGLVMTPLVVPRPARGERFNATKVKLYGVS